MGHRFKANSNSGLIKYLQEIGIIKSEIVLNALLSIDRGNYVDNEPYTDSPQYIGYGATISAPHMHASALEYLHQYIMRNNSSVLDVGLGSGYLTSVMSKMNPTAKVVGIDIIKELVDLAIDNILKKDSELITSERVSCITGNGWEGYSKYAPYDCIHVGADASEIPKELLNQLKVGGRLIIPVGQERSAQQLLQVDKIGNGNSPNDFKIEALMDVMYVPLVKTND